MNDPSSNRIVLAVPSKGRLMDDAAALLSRAGLELVRTGSERGYRGEVRGLDGVDVAFVSASEIAELLRDGRVHVGITGEDLARETIADLDEIVDFRAKLGFGHADVVVAVPDFWIDVARMADLEEAAVSYRRRHGRRMRVATKYSNLTRRHFAGHRLDGRGPSADIVTMYRLVGSLGATEGAPAAGTAELIVDITSSGSTLRANGLRILDDGCILKSEANLVSSRRADWSERGRQCERELVERVVNALSARG